MLHSYELVAGLGALAWLTGWVWLWGYLLGVALHLPLDIVFNGRYEPGGPLRFMKFYSLAYRWRLGFRADRLLTGAYLGPTPPGFLAGFFLGPEVRRPAPEPATPAVGLLGRSPSRAS